MLVHTAALIKGDENPLSKGEHRQVSLIEVENNFILTEKLMWDVNEN